MLPSFNVDLMVQIIIKHRIEELTLAPPILIRLVRDPVVDKYLPQLRQVIKRFSVGSASTKAEVIRLLQAKFPGPRIPSGVWSY